MPRPRIHPEGTTPSDRARLAERRVIDAGGRRLQVLLSPAATAALAKIRAELREPSDVATLERLLVTAEAAMRG